MIRWIRDDQEFFEGYILAQTIPSINWNVAIPLLTNALPSLRHLYQAKVLRVAPLHEDMMGHR